MNKKKALFYLFSVMVFIGFFGLVGTAGAIDWEEISLCRAMYEEDPPFLLLDDPFANLDDDRLKAATGLLKELADTFQIFYFVCHSSRADKALSRKE